MSTMEVRLGGIEEPDLRFHRECMSALLNDARTLAVVLAAIDERASQYARRREIAERVGSNIGAYGRLPRDRALIGS